MQQLGNSQKEYEKAVVTFSVRNQVRFRGSLGKELNARNASECLKW